MINKQATHSQSGFTLMEIIIVVAVFSITVVLAVDLFLAYTKLQKRAATEQSIGADARFVTESIVRQMRLGTIDYDYYADPDNDPFTADDISLLDADMPLAILALIDQGGGGLLYRLTVDGNSSGRIELSTNRGEDWLAITPSSIDVERMDFYVSPSKNPFQLKDPIPETGSKYESDQQPRVTIVIETKSVNEQPPVTTRLQTTATSRLYVR